MFIELNWSSLFTIDLDITKNRQNNFLGSTLLRVLLMYLYYFLSITSSPRQPRKQLQCPHVQHISLSAYTSGILVIIEKETFGTLIDFSRSISGRTYRNSPTKPVMRHMSTPSLYIFLVHSNAN